MPSLDLNYVPVTIRPVTPEVIALVEEGEKALERDARQGSNYNEKVFDLVQSEVHWKDPIHALVRDVPVDLSQDLLGLIEGAVMFFTATSLETARIIPQVKTSKVTIVVQAIGYRAGPAGP